MIAFYKKDDTVYVHEGLTNRIEKALVIDEPVYKTIWHKKGWWYKIMTETRIEAEKQERNELNKNELFQWYIQEGTEYNHRLRHLQG